MYQPRTYRHWVKETDLVSFEVAVKETDLRISARRNLRRKAYKSVEKYRKVIERYIEQHPAFLTALQPFPVRNDDPLVIREMARAAEAVSLGPMAAVAGTIAEAVGKDLLCFTREVIVENGGDIFLKAAHDRIVSIYAGDSPLSGKVALRIQSDKTPLGICTSSGTVGHSLSMGTADAVVVLASSAAFADAVATAVGNIIKRVEDIDKGLSLVQQTVGIIGVIIIKDDRLGAWGDVNIISV